MAERERHPRTPKRPRLYAAVAAVAVVMAVLSVASLARAAVLPPEPPALSAAPEWAAIPTADEMQRAYPARARRDGVEGRATLRCAVRPSGELASCEVVSETPADRGFGRAALELADESFRMTGRPEGSGPDPTVRIPVVFALAEPAPEPDGADEEETSWPWLALLGALIGGAKLLGEDRRRQLAFRAGRLVRQTLRGRPRELGSATSRPAPGAPPVHRTPDIVTEGRRRWPWSSDRR